MNESPKTESETAVFPQTAETDCILKFGNRNNTSQ